MQATSVQLVVNPHSLRLVTLRSQRFCRRVWHRFAVALRRDNVFTVSRKNMNGVGPLTPHHHSEGFVESHGPPS